LEKTDHFKSITNDIR